MKYRIKQFYWHIVSNWIEVDKKLIKKYLNKDEIEIFNRLKTSEKHHCVRVCNDAMEKIKKEKIDIDKDKLGKVALLHDVGKISKSLNVVDKSLLVILDKATNGKLKKYTNIKKIDVYYNHPKKGVNILKRLDNYDREFLDVVEKHHENNKKNNNRKSNIYLDIIKECDDKN